MHELTKKGKKKTKEEKKKEEAVEYSLGNETIIQPKHSRFRQVTAQLAVANIFIGAAIGAAIIWFLVAPAVNQSRSERMNDRRSALRRGRLTITELQAKMRRRMPSWHKRQRKAMKNC